MHTRAHCYMASVQISRLLQVEGVAALAQLGRSIDVPSKSYITDLASEESGQFRRPHMDCRGLKECSVKRLLSRAISSSL